MGQLHFFLRILTYAAVYSIGFLILSAIDPFKVDQAVDQQARDILYRAFAPNYSSSDIDVDQFCPNAVDADECPPEVSWLRDPLFKQKYAAKDDTIEQVNNSGPLPEAGGSIREAGLEYQYSQDQIVTVHLSDLVLRSIRTNIQNSLNSPELSEEEREFQALMHGWYSWRPTYRDHADLIRNITNLWRSFPEEQQEAAKPPAIFFDFIFVEDGGTHEEKAGFEEFINVVKEITAHEKWKDKVKCEDPIYRLACIKSAGGTPLIFAKAQPRIMMDKGDRSPAQEVLQEVAILAPVRFVGKPGDYPIATNSLTDSELLRFRAENRTEIDRLYPTPAVLLYLSWCMDNPRSCRSLDPLGEGSDEDRYDRIITNFYKTYKLPISVRWGSAVPDFFVGIERMISGDRPQLRETKIIGDRIMSYGSGAGDFACRYEPEAMFAPLKLLARQVFSNRQDPGPGNLVQGCRYHLEVPYDLLASENRSDVLVNAAFNGRLIVVGAQFRNSSDLVWSPVHGQIPGLHGHAMATDNLIATQKDYLRSVPDVGWIPNVDWLDIFETGVMFFLILVVSLGQWWLNHRMIKNERMKSATGKDAKAPGHILIYLIVGLSIVTLVFLAILLQVKVFDWAPMNWISVIMASVALFVFLLRDEIADDLTKFFTKCPLVKRAGVPTLEWWVKTRRYLDMETVGFEKGRSLTEARAEKDRVVAALYPDIEEQPDSSENDASDNGGEDDVGPSTGPDENKGPED